MQTFTTFHQSSGLFQETHHADSLFDMWGWSQEVEWQPIWHGTHFGTVSSGTLTLECDSGVFTLNEGMVFCIPRRLRLRGPGTAFGITARSFNGFFQVAGPVEKIGRLRYIDGCTDSLVIAPQVKGEPCLNHLHFPPHTDQTLHTHPSFRAGLVLRGRGACKLAGNEVPLVSGTVFHLPHDVIHGFRTDDETMDVIAFHPDSDHGPMNNDHPMINRTIVNGISANRITEIRT
jgi:quercetin dioxygenase-like cupin family protein